VKSLTVKHLTQNRVKHRKNIGIGVDAIPFAIRNSKILTGNNLGQLGNVTALPSDDEINAYSQSAEIKELLDATIGDNQSRELQLHLKAKALLEQGPEFDTRIIKKCDSSMYRRFFLHF